jgi:hypothetical protein
MASRHRSSHALRRPRSRGQAVVEFALILPLMLLLTIGVVDLARIFSSYIALTDGVREGALYAAQGTNNLRWCSGDPGDPDAVACPLGSNPLVNETGTHAGNIAFQINSAGLDVAGIDMWDPVCKDELGAVVPTCDATSTITITATYQMDLLTPILGDLLGQNVLVKAKTTAKVLQ